MASLERVEVDVTALAPGATYPWLTAGVIPRPIAWVATRSAAGVDNLAPHSFFTVASAEPPVLAFTSVGTKDTLRNIRATGEFVVCLAPRHLADAVNLTGTNFPGDISEFDAVGLAREPSVAVAPSRVAASPIALECRFEGEKAFGQGPRASVMVFGRVVHIGAHAGALADDGLPDAGALDPASRLGREEWGGVGELYRIARVPFEKWPPPSGAKAP